MRLLTSHPEKGYHLDARSYSQVESLKNKSAKRQHVRQYRVRIP